MIIFVFKKKYILFFFLIIPLITLKNNSQIYFKENSYPIIKA